MCTPACTCVYVGINVCVYAWVCATLALIASELVLLGTPL